MEVLLTEEDEEILEWWDEEWDEMTGVLVEPGAGVDDDDDEDDDLLVPAAAPAAPESLSLRFGSSFFLSSFSFFMLAFDLKRCLNPLIILCVWGCVGRYSLYGRACNYADIMCSIRSICVYICGAGVWTKGQMAAVSDGESNDSGDGRTEGDELAGGGCSTQCLCVNPCECDVPVVCPNLLSCCFSCACTGPCADPCLPLSPLVVLRTACSLLPCPPALPETVQNANIASLLLLAPVRKPRRRVGVLGGPIVKDSCRHRRDVSDGTGLVCGCRGSFVLVHGRARPPVLVAHVSIPHDARHVHDDETVRDGYKAEVHELEEWPHTPVCDKRLPPALVKPRLHCGGRLALHGTHAPEVERNADGGPAELVDCDPGGGVKQRAAAGGGLSQWAGSRAGSCSGGESQLPPARKADVAVEPPVELAGDRGKDEAAVDAVAGRALIVVVGVDEEHLGDDVAGAKERARHEHVRHERSFREELVVTA